MFAWVRTKESKLLDGSDIVRRHDEHMRFLDAEILRIKKALRQKKLSARKSKFRWKFRTMRKRRLR